MLGPRHFDGAGVDPATIAIAGMEGCPQFAATPGDDQRTLDLERLEQETVCVALKLARANPKVARDPPRMLALAALRRSVQGSVRFPVFDFTHLVAMVHDAVARPDIRGTRQQRGALCSPRGMNCGAGVDEAMACDPIMGVMNGAGATFEYSGWSPVEC